MDTRRIGVDFGGTKIEIAALDDEGAILFRHRVPTPGSYDAAIRAVQELVVGVDARLGQQATIGVGIPGSISPATGLVKNANSTWLNGRTFDRDLVAAVGRAVRVENDANCFALSEAVDGAAEGLHVVFGVIIGTGCGGGIVVDGRVLTGANSICGEWGHNPLPWPRVEEFPMPTCFCGNVGCMERFVAGPSLAEDCDGPGHYDASSIPERARGGEQVAVAALARHADRLARGLAQIVNLLDPDAIVLGGGLSNMDHLYRDLPRLLSRNVITDQVRTRVLRNRHGDSSGVRGAAWLWSKESRIA